MGMIIFTNKFVDEHTPIHLMTGKPITAGVMSVLYTGKGEWYTVEVEHKAYTKLIMGWWVWLDDFAHSIKVAGAIIGSYVDTIAIKLECRFEDRLTRKLKDEGCPEKDVSIIKEGGEGQPPRNKIPPSERVERPIRPEIRIIKEGKSKPEELKVENEKDGEGSMV